MSPELAGGFSTTEPPGSQIRILYDNAITLSALLSSVSSPNENQTLRGLGNTDLQSAVQR